MKNPILFLSLILMIVFSCRDKNFIEPDIEDYEYKIPNELNDGWETASANDVGLDEEKFVELVKYLNSSIDNQFHSILIAKDNKLIFEKYFSGYKFDINSIKSEQDIIQFGVDTLHYLASVSKSITSLLLGIAIDNGAEISLDDTLLSYYPQYSAELIGEKSLIQLNHLLTMSAGLSWDESTYSYGDPKNDVTQLFVQSDPLQYILRKPIESLPGTKFSYNSGYTNIIADVLQLKTGVTFNQFAHNNLFSKLGIDSYKWEMINGNLIFASGGLYLTPRDLAKIGYVFLNEGKWLNTQIVSNGWIEQSFENYINPNYYYYSNGYGLQWWKNTFHTTYGSYECYFAAGWGEQFLYILPELDMEIVITGGYYFNNYIELSPHSIVNDYILYSLKKE